MGNCLLWEKGSSNPDEKLCRDMINELKEKRVNKLCYLNFKFEEK